MTCPFYNRDFIGVCGALKFRYAPSLAEIEDFCCSPDFRFCTKYLFGASMDEQTTDNRCGAPVRDRGSEVSGSVC